MTSFPDPNVLSEFTGANGITYSWDATDGKWVIKSFAVEDVIGPCASSANTICDQLTELEEEIDAIAPSVERGTWTMNLLGTVAQKGQMSLYDADYTTVGSPTGLFKSARSIWLNELDNDGTPHGFENVKAGELIELFVQGSSEYGLYEVVDTHDETNGATQWWVIEVNFIRTLEDTSTADNGDLIRVKIFQAPSGGTADGFVLKSGDEMTGRLTLDIEEEDLDYRIKHGKDYAQIRFRNTQADGTENNVYLYQPGPLSSVYCTAGFQAGTLYTNTYLYGLQTKTEVDGRQIKEQKKVSLALIAGAGGDRNLDYGALQFHTDKILTWHSEKVEARKPIQFADVSTNTEDDHAIHKGYVDEKITENRRVIITPLEFFMDSYSQYPNDDGITGLTSGGNPTGSRDVYGYHIPWLWFEKNHPELIGFIYTQEGNLINSRSANLYVRTLNNRPGLEIKASSNPTSYATVTIQGWHVPVDDISEDQYTHKF